MPIANEMSENFSPSRVLVMGDTKAGKTDYIFRAAEAGFTVLYMDGDVGVQCLQAMIRTGRLSKAAASRIVVLKINDYNDRNGVYVPFMAEFFVKFTTSGKFLWNDSLQRVFKPSEYLKEEGHVVWELRPAMLTPDVIVGIDSWTTLASSVLHWKADDLKVDLSDIDKVGRDMYSGVGHKLTQFLTLMSRLPCHLAVTGHPREYQKMKPPKGQRIENVKEKDMEIEWIKMVPVSSSNPHALTLGKNFSDIGWIDIDRMGRRVIDFKVSDSRIIGGHLDAKGPVDELTLASLITQTGGAVPKTSSMDSWLTQYGPGEYELPAAKVLTPAAKPNSTTGAVAQPLKGLGALASLKANNVQK